MGVGKLLSRRTGLELKELVNVREDISQQSRLERSQRICLKFLGFREVYNLSDVSSYGNLRSCALCDNRINKSYRVNGYVNVSL